MEFEHMFQIFYRIVMQYIDRILMTHSFLGINLTFFKI